MLTAWFGAAEESAHAVVAVAADVVAVTVAAHVEPVGVEPSTVVVVAVVVLLFPLAAVESESAKKAQKHVWTQNCEDG